MIKIILVDNVTTGHDISCGSYVIYQNKKYLSCNGRINEDLLLVWTIGTDYYGTIAKSNHFDNPGVWQMKEHYFQ